VSLLEGTGELSASGAVSSRFEGESYRGWEGLRRVEEDELTWLGRLAMPTPAAEVAIVLRRFVDG
jgi:hypothetical protein